MRMRDSASRDHIVTTALSADKKQPAGPRLGGSATDRPVYCRRNLDSYIHRAALAIHQQQILVFRVVHRRREIGGVVDRLAIDFLNHVSALEAGIGSGAGGIHFSDHHTRGAGRNAKLLGEIGIQILHGDAGLLAVGVAGAFLRTGLLRGELTQRCPIYRGRRRCGAP